MIAGSIAGAFVEHIAHAQFSQHEERQADLYGLLFLKQEGYDPKAAISALRKLSTLGGNHTFLSSHPAPLDRITHLDRNTSDKTSGSMLGKVYDSAKLMLINGAQLVWAMVNWLLSFL